MNAAERRAYETATERADGRCEGCGKYAHLERHHCRYRSRGGKTTTENIFLLCGWGNHTGCHGKAHSADPPEGWAVSQFDKRPDHEIPRQTFEGLAVLTRDGRRAPVGDPAATPS